MKWRPISELSDEQRDGRWWVFTTGEPQEPTTTACKFCHYEGWRDDIGEEPYLKNGIPNYNYFLSEPLPDFPKPQKMEWRKFEDEMPEEESNILIMFDNKKYMVYTNFDSRVLSIAGPEKAEYWMPIIPPEDE